jgi:hypothetical protein
MKGLLAFAFVIGGEAVVLFLDRPHALVIGMMAIAAGILLLAEIAYGMGVGVGIAWIVSGVALWWISTKLDHSARGWVALAGGVATFLFAGLALRGAQRRQIERTIRDRHRW